MPQTSPSFRIVLAWCAAVGFLIQPHIGRAGISVINFDGIPDNTIINTYYPGLTFLNPLGGDIYARYGNGLAPSQSNVVSILPNTSLFGFFDASNGAVDVILSTPRAFGQH